MIKVILASQSPRRKDLMPMITGKFSCVAPKIEETLNPDLSPEEAAMDLAERKAKSVMHKKLNPKHLVLGCDTIIVLDDEIFGKPKDLDDARRMLKKLQGRTHRVITGCAFVNQYGSEKFYDESKVKITGLTDYSISQYFRFADPLDYCGGYALQQVQYNIVESYEGSPFNIVGLPVEVISERYAVRVDKRRKV